MAGASWIITSIAQELHSENEKAISAEVH